MCSARPATTLSRTFAGAGAFVPARSVGDPPEVEHAARKPRRAPAAGAGRRRRAPRQRRRRAPKTARPVAGEEGCALAAILDRSALLLDRCRAAPGDGAAGAHRRAAPDLRNVRPGVHLVTPPGAAREGGSARIRRSTACSAIHRRDDRISTRVGQLRRMVGGNRGLRVLLRGNRALRIQFADQLAAREHVPDVRHAVHALRRLRLPRGPAMSAWTSSMRSWSLRGRRRATSSRRCSFSSNRRHPGVDRRGAFAADAIRAGGEHSFTEWGIQYWPVKLTMPVGAALLLLQGIARLIAKDVTRVKQQGSLTRGLRGTGIGSLNASPVRRPRPASGCLACR